MHDHECPLRDPPSSLVVGLRGSNILALQTGTGGTSGQHSNTVGATGATVRGGGTWIYLIYSCSTPRKTATSSKRIELRIIRDSSWLLAWPIICVYGHFAPRQHGGRGGEKISSLPFTFHPQVLTLASKSPRPQKR
jgi:hypothetical protein